MNMNITEYYYMEARIHDSTIIRLKEELTMAKYNRIRWVAMVALVMVLMSGCSLLKLGGQSKSIDPPPAGANQTMDDGSLATIAGINSTMDSAGSSTTQVTLYF